MREGKRIRTAEGIEGTYIGQVVIEDTTTAWGMDKGRRRQWHQVRLDDGSIMNTPTFELIADNTESGMLLGDFIEAE